MENPPEDVFEHMQALFEQMFTGFSGARIVPLRVERGYRGIVTEKRAVSFKRRARCAPCRAQGCRRCGGLGWSVVAENITVTVPDIAQPGMKLRVSGKGDDIDHVTVREIHIEIVDDDAREAELRTDQEGYELTIERTWRKERDELRSRQRRSWLAVGVVLLVVVGIPALYWASDWLSRARVGAPCAYDRECRSNQCLTAGGPLQVDDLLRVDARRVCTEACETDEQCPSSMSCSTVYSAYGGLHVSTGVPQGRACVPRMLAE